MSNCVLEKNGKEGELQLYSKKSPHSPWEYYRSLIVHDILEISRTLLSVNPQGCLQLSWFPVTGRQTSEPVFGGCR